MFLFASCKNKEIDDRKYTTKQYNIRGVNYFESSVSGGPYILFPEEFKVSLSYKSDFGWMIKLPSSDIKIDRNGYYVMDQKGNVNGLSKSEYFSFLQKENAQ